MVGMVGWAGPGAATCWVDPPSTKLPAAVGHPESGLPRTRCSGSLLPSSCAACLLGVPSLKTAAPTAFPAAARWTALCSLPPHFPSLITAASHPQPLAAARWTGPSSCGAWTTWRTWTRCLATKRVGAHVLTRSGCTRAHAGKVMGAPACHRVVDTRLGHQAGGFSRGLQHRCPCLPAIELWAHRVVDTPSGPQSWREVEWRGLANSAVANLLQRAVELRLGHQLVPAC